MGNVAVTVVGRDVKGTEREVVADVTLSGAYAAGGDTIVAADILKLLPDQAQGLAQIRGYDLESPLTGERAILDKAAKKVKAFTAAGVEVAGNQSTVVFRLTARYGQVTG